MQEEKKLHFCLYRFQMNPISKNLQLDLHETDIGSIEDLRSKKNSILSSVIGLKFKFKSPRPAIETKVLHNDGTLIIFRIGVRRNVKITRQDFTRDLVENWPPIIVIFHNDPRIQVLAVQKNAASLDPDAVVRVIETSLSEALLSRQLGITIKPIFRSSDFWEVVKKYPRDITQITFEFVRPNLSSISKTLAGDLKELVGSVNSERTSLEFNSPEGGHLEIDENSNGINGLVNYSAQGGGDIKLYMKGIKKTIRTKDSVIVTEIEEALFEGPNIEFAIESLKKILSDGNS